MLPSESTSHISPPARSCRVSPSAGSLNRSSNPFGSRIIPGANTPGFFSSTACSAICSTSTSGSVTFSARLPDATGDSVTVRTGFVSLVRTVCLSSELSDSPNFPTNNHTAAAPTTTTVPAMRPRRRGRDFLCPPLLTSLFSVGLFHDIYLSSLKKKPARALRTGFSW